MKIKCKNPNLAGAIMVEITFNATLRRGIHLTPEQSEHLVQCEECNQMLPLWFKKAAVAREGTETFNIINLAEAGDSRVLKKSTRSGVALFKPNEEDSSDGVVVQIDSTGAITRAGNISFDDFERLE